VLDTIDHEEEVDSTNSHVCDALKTALGFTFLTGRRVHLGVNIWKGGGGGGVSNFIHYLTERRL
jgi:hypothetical protein